LTWMQIGTLSFGQPYTFSSFRYVSPASPSQNCRLRQLNFNDTSDGRFWGSTERCSMESETINIFSKDGWQFVKWYNSSFLNPPLTWMLVSDGSEQQ
jgi:hypothetical protein